MAKKTRNRVCKATVVEQAPAGAQLLTVGQVAWAMGGMMSVATVQRWAKDPDSGFPSPIVVGGQQHRWHRSDVEAYIASRTPPPGAAV